MSEHFIKYIKIGRYKCFEDFSAEGFGRVNLISGKNNVGKTALMEALYANAYAIDIPNFLEGLWFLYGWRNRAESVDQQLTTEEVAGYVKRNSELIRNNTNINELSFEYKKSELEQLYTFQINESKKTYSDSELNIFSIMQNAANSRSICFIPSVRDSQADIIRSYRSIQEKDRETEVNTFISRFDSSIENVKVIGDAIQCKVPIDDGFEYRSLNEFGDGLRHYLSVISDMFGAENYYIFIDELDNGIHFTLLDELWEIILTLSKELNVQVFATTHSKECIESYCRVAEKMNEQDVSLITLVKNKSQQIKAIVRDYEMLVDSINDEREVRGW